MHIITIYVTFLQLKNTAFTDFKEEFVNRIRENEKKKKYSQKGNDLLGCGLFWVGR